MVMPFTPIYSLLCRCVHCHSLDRIYREAAKQLAPQGVQLARVDTSTESTLKSKYQIAQVPALKIFRKGQVFNYDGPNEDKGAQGSTQTTPTLVLLSWLLSKGNFFPPQA